MPGNNVSGLSFDATSIEKAEKAITKLVKSAETGIGKVNKSWKDMTKDGLNHFIQRLGVAQRAMSQLSSARLNVRFTGQANELKKLGDAATRAIPQVNRLITAMQQLSRLNINVGGIGSGANSTAADAQKIKYLEDQIKLLQEQLKVQKEIGKAVGAQVNNTDRVKKSMTSLGDVARKVRQIAGTIFSVQALVGYGNQLLKIRGEFEMQHRSLQVLLQDVDKANELWDKTVSLAVKSPFRVKELVTYTKQLAAYRVEADKLYETNRMLADVSAGLGVDMNRLILAFGQVKAANFLRGTELRQFSEAGVNMLEELAKRFTELEGRAVSVGDVFERVSKRMVSFADVEAVFQTITSEGGTFYKMQEKQSETLRGMMMNLRDSIDLMFNDIGISHDSTLKGAVRLVKQLVDNWREMIPLLKTVGVAIGATFATKGIVKYIKQLVILNKQVRQVGIGMSLLKSANVWGILVGAVAGFITYIVAARRNINELTAAMNQVDTDVSKQLEESITLYRKLAEQVQDVTITEKERNKAMSQLKARFNEILPDQLLELEYIQGISDNYEEATEAMMNYYNAKATEQKKDRVESLYAEELEGKNVPALINSIRRAIEKNELVGDRTKQVLLAGVAGAIGDVTNDVKNGAIDADADSLVKALEDKLNEYAGLTDFKLFENIEGYYTIPEAILSQNLDNIIKTIGEYKTALDSVTGLPFKTDAEKQATRIFLPQKENIEAVKNAFNEISSTINQYYSSIEGFDEEELDKAIENIIKKLPEEAEAYIPALREAFKQMIVEADKGAYEFKSALQGIQQGFLYSLPSIIGGQTNLLGTIPQDTQDALTNLVENIQESLNEEGDKLELTDFQKAVDGVFKDVAQSFKGVDLDLFAQFIPDARKSRGELIKELNALEEQYVDTVAAWDKSIAEGVSIQSASYIHQVSKETIDQMRKEIPALDKAAKKLGELEKDKKGRTDNTLDERIKVIDQMNAKYKELNKTLSESESLQGAFEAYKDAFATAYGREDVRAMTAEDFAKNVLNFPDENAVIKWLDDLAKTVKDKEDKIKVELAKGKFEMDVDVRLKKEADEELKREIEDMFDRYDLTLELDKIRAPKGFIKNLFGVDQMSLPALRAEVESREGDFIGTDMEEDYKNFLEKINDLESKELEQKAKKFVSYLEKNLDEIENIQRGRGLDISFAQELFDEGKISAELFAEAVQSIVAETNKEISKLNLEKFKESPEYIQVMGDMTAYSVEELKRLSSKLKDIIADNGHAFSADELKVYHDALEKVNSRIQKLDEGLVYDKDIRNLKDIKRLNEEIATEKEREYELNTKLTQQEMYRMSLVSSLDMLQKQRDEAKAKGQDTTLLDSLILMTQRQIAQANDDVAGTEASLNSSKSLLAELGAELNTILNNETEAFAKLQAYVNIFNKSLGAFSDVFNGVKGVVDSFGVDTDSGVWGTMSVAIESLSSVGNKASESVTKFMSGDPIGGTMAALGAVFEAIKGVNKIIDKKQENTIQEQLKLIERLGDEYKDLEKDMAKAFNAKDLESHNKAMKENVDLQLKAYETAIAAENDKKDTDPERVRELTQEYNALKDSWEEFQTSQLESMGGTKDYRGATEGFVDAWREAFQETGNGLIGLQDNFKEFFANVVKQQALTQGASSIMQQLFDEINKSLEGDYTISDDEYKNIDDVQEKVLKELDKFLEGYYSRYGDILQEGETGNLSQLQKGIQGVTEQTAQVIESLLNSMRFYQADSNAELKSQTKYMRDMYNMLSSMTAVHPTLGGRGIKVVG